MLEIVKIIAFLLTVVLKYIVDRSTMIYTHRDHARYDLQRAIVASQSISCSEHRQSKPGI